MSTRAIDAAELRRAVEILRAGGLVAFPTETVYGLGADASNPAALRRLYAVKGRPPHHPVIVHVAEASQLDDWAAEVPPAARVLADGCWPGPLTLVVRRAAHVVDEVTGGHDTVGVRVPDQPVALALLRAFGGGISAPSANRFGRVSPTTAADVRRELAGEIGMVLDGGPCSVGVESTIVDCTGDAVVVLRPGGVPIERVEELLGEPVRERRAGDTAAPGTLPSHYAPHARVELVDAAAISVRAEELVRAGRRVGLLATTALDGVPRPVVVLEPPGDVDTFARVLYARLREADDVYRLDVLLVVPPPPAGLGAAVVDRLRRAAGVRGTET